MNDARDLSGTDLPESYLSRFRAPSGYVDFARFGPVSLDAAAAVRTAFENLAASADAADQLFPVAAKARALAAELTGRASADQVGLVPNTSTGLFQIAFALRCEAVLVSPREFPANVYPWVQAARRGGPEVVWLETPDGRVMPDAVAAALAPRIGALAVSAVDFRTGYRVDLPALRAVLGERLLVLDAIQGFGVADQPWHLADAVVTGGQKWLRGGWGSGFISLSERALDRLEGALSGWSGAVAADRFDNTLHAPAPSAARFSMTNPDLCAVAALEAALRLFQAAGAAPIERAVAARADAMLAVIAAHGGRTLVPLGPRERAGIIPLVMDVMTPDALGAALRAAGLTISVRADHVRLSPHATTPMDAVDRLEEALRRRSCRSA